jgi:hypothetical protein
MKRKFTGYRSHPTYIERVTNFLNHIQSSTDEAKQTQPIEEEQEDEVLESSSLNFQRQPQTTSLAKGKQSQQTTLMPQSSSKQPTQPSQPSQPVQQRKITTSDLRNKRNQVVSNTYRPVAPSQGRKANPTYSVKMAFGSGAYQMDSY